MNNPVEVLGVDVGGVLTPGRKDNTDVFLDARDVSSVDPMDYAFEGLRRLVDEKFGENVHIVSKCGDNMRDKILKWFSCNNFYSRTAINPKNVHFCRERKGKGDICNSLGITHFVDDRLEILGYLTEAGVDNLYLFNPNEREVERYRQHLPRVVRVGNWRELVERILRE